MISTYSLSSKYSCQLSMVISTVTGWGSVSEGWVSVVSGSVSASVAGAAWGTVSDSPASSRM